jgi:hypothetical protein
MQICCRSRKFCFYSLQQFLVNHPYFIFHYRSFCSKRCDPLQDGFATWNVSMKRLQKNRWVSIIDSPLFTKLRYANTRCCNVHCGMMVTEMAWPDEFNCPLPNPLNSSICSATSISKTFVSRDAPCINWYLVFSVRVFYHDSVNKRMRLHVLCDKCRSIF